MFVGDVLEVVDADLRYEQRDCDGFDGGVTPAVIVDAAFPVDVVDVVNVVIGPPDVEVRNLEVIIEYAAGWPRELGSDAALAHVVTGGFPKTYNARCAIIDYCCVTVLDATAAHKSEDVVADWTYDVGVVVQSPDIL